MPFREIKVEKLYYSIGEVAEMLSVPVSTVRFWDNEFDILKPVKNKKGNRMFTPNDVKNIKIIHHLLKEEGLTIDGARKKMSEKWADTEYRYAISESLLRIKSLLLELRDGM